jgi:hypothetical protein
MLSWREFLTTKAGMDGHPQNDVAEVHHLLDEDEGLAGLSSAPVFVPSSRTSASPRWSGSGRMAPQNKKVIGANVDKCFPMAFGFGDHQQSLLQLIFVCEHY